MKKTRTIKVDYLARVEGEGALYLKIAKGKVADVKLKIFEPPRFFEAFLRGRCYSETPDITARICGICPVAYQMSAVHAIEDALGMQIPEPIRALRRLLYCGEWIESHVLHVYMLHAPDFLGYPDAIRLAKDAPKEVKRGLSMKKAGNRLVSLVGGREIHPINVRVGGFYKWPVPSELKAFLEQLHQARSDAIETIRWVAGFSYPDYEMDYLLVSLQHPEEYPMNAGELVSNRGLRIDARDFYRFFEERHVAHSNALHAVFKDDDAAQSYLVGPLARFALNYERLSPTAKSLAEEVGIGPECRNPFKSIIVRSIEVLYAFEEAIRLIECYKPQGEPWVAPTVRSGIGHACTEAPRGLLYHRYRLGPDGEIVDAKIVPPTSQNQLQIEADLRGMVPGILHLDDKALTGRCEQAIRNYDPCISCSAHFLKMDIERV